MWLLLLALYPASIAAGWFHLWPWLVVPPAIMAAYIFSSPQRMHAYLRAISAERVEDAKGDAWAKAMILGRNLVQYGIPFGLGWTARYVIQ